MTSTSTLEMPADQRPANHFTEHLMWVLLALFVLWGIHIFEVWSNQSLSHWGLFPRDPRGLLGVLTMPFLHGDLEHLVGNSFGLFILGMISLQFYKDETPLVALAAALAGGLLVWCFARPVYHIGSSGIVYALSAFLFSGALFNKGRVYKAPALIVVMLFGGSVWGIFPIYKGVSWEGHLFGALTGIYMAALFRRVPAPEIEDDDEADENPISIASPIAEQAVLPVRRLSHTLPKRPFVMTARPPRANRIEDHELETLMARLPRPIPLKPDLNGDNDPEQEP